MGNCKAIDEEKDRDTYNEIVAYLLNETIQAEDVKHQPGRLDSHVGGLCNLQAGMIFAQPRWLFDQKMT